MRHVHSQPPNCPLTVGAQSLRSFHAARALDERQPHPSTRRSGEQPPESSAEARGRTAPPPSHGASPACSRSGTTSACHVERALLSEEPEVVRGREHSLARAAHWSSLQRDGDAGRHVAAGWEVRAARRCGATQGRCEEAILVGLARVDACARRPRRRRASRAAANTIVTGAACRVVAHADLGRAVARALDERAADAPSVAGLWRVQVRGPRARRQSGRRTFVGRAARDGKCGDEHDHA